MTKNAASPRASCRFCGSDATAGWGIREPDREPAMPVTEVRHPLIRHKLGLMRRAGISTKEFRELASEVAALLTYEATKDMDTLEDTIEGWAGPVTVERIKGKKRSEEHTSELQS